MRCRARAVVEFLGVRSMLLILFRGNANADAKRSKGERIKCERASCFDGFSSVVGRPDERGGTARVTSSPFIRCCCSYTRNLMKHRADFSSSCVPAAIV